MVICLERSANYLQYCFIKIQIGLIFLVLVVLEKRPLNGCHANMVRRQCRRRRRRSEMTSSGQSLYARILHCKIQLLILILISNNNSVSPVIERLAK